MGKNEKTNAMRLLDQRGIPYETLHYPHENEAKDAVTVAGLLGMDPKTVYKTLVMMGPDNNGYVALIAGPDELDLKKAAAAFSVKSLRMLHVDELKPLTGYIRGGCSPIGMKKPLATLIDKSAQDLPFILVSAGQIGSQIMLNPKDLAACAKARFADISRQNNHQGEGK